MSVQTSKSAVTPPAIPAHPNSKERSARRLVVAAIGSFFAHIVIWLIPPALFVAGLFLAMSQNHQAAGITLSAGTWVVIGIPLAGLVVTAVLALRRKFEMAVGILIGAANVLTLLVIIPVTNRMLFYFLFIVP
jgi:hypothetical protein